METKKLLKSANIWVPLPLLPTSVLQHKQTTNGLKRVSIDNEDKFPKGGKTMPSNVYRQYKRCDRLNKISHEAVLVFN